MLRITHVPGRRAARKKPPRSVLHRTVTVALLLALGLFFLPSLLAGSPLLGDTQPQTMLPINPTSAGEDAQPTAGRDRGRPVRLAHSDGSVEQLTMDTYLWGVVAAEMPASFELEALKAQAVAARTYTAAKLNSSKHPDADVCDNSGCCQAYTDYETAAAGWGGNAQTYGEKITQAVQATDGLGVLYEGGPIQAVFFSSADGQTADAVQVWGSSVSYLVGVESPEGEEVPNYHTTAVFSPDQARAALLAAYPGADLSAGPDQWLGEVTWDEAGRVEMMVFGGVTLTGAKARSVFSLRSASFDPVWDGTQFVFSVTGYGHGVGMSQYGANAMAKEGSDFEDILTWYYTGTQVGPLWDSETE